MKTCFYYGDPYKQVNKNFTYHGINSKCVKPPKPKSFDDYDVPISSYEIETVEAKNINNNSATLVGLLWVAAGAEPAILRGFEYRPKGADYYLISYELGEFMSCEYEQEISF
jgi:hypothetical protein